MLEEIYNKTNIDMTAFIKRLEIELSINGIKDEEKKKIASAQLVCSIYDTMIIILGKTHQEKILNELYTTWYDFTKEILEEQGITCKVNPVTTEQYIEMMKVTQAKRPFNSQMSKAKLEACGIKVPEWKDGLKRYLEEAKKLEQ